MRVGIIGIGQTRFGELWNSSLRQLGVEAGLLAIADAGIERSALNSLYVGNMAGGLMTGQEHIAALLADQLGLACPAVRVEGACASGGLAVRQALLAIKAGAAECCLVIGVEKMTELPVSAVQCALIGAGDWEWEASSGLTFAGLYALMARAHMHAWHTTRQQLAQVSVINHNHGLTNPLAQFRSAISVEDVLASQLVADPLRVLDCSPLSDGASALVLANEAIIKELRVEQPVWIVGSGHASDALALHDRADLIEIRAVRSAVVNALNQASLSVDRVDVFELHDCFSINEILMLEALGLCSKGQGGKLVEAGEIGLDGAYPTNTSGGLKAVGHPVGATGVRQVCDIVRQLRGQAWNPVNAQIGMAVNVGGVGATAVAHVLSVD